MDVLIACECSGMVRNAFLAMGHNAISCDILPSDSKGPHCQGDVSSLLRLRWDLVIAFPPCTYLCNSGVRWVWSDFDRWAKLVEGADLYNQCCEANAPMVVVENPIMHKYAAKMVKYRYSQIIQPWQFGHGETKATTLYLKGVPKLEPTNIVSGRVAYTHLLPPSKHRSKLRSETKPGIAIALAEQLGTLK